MFKFNSEFTLSIAVFAALGFAYFVQFQLVRDGTFLDSLRSTLINIIPIALLGVSIRTIVRSYLVSLPVIVQLIAHTFLAIIFTHLWYLLVLVAASFHIGWLKSGIQLSPFYDSATLWQFLQGIVVYMALQGLIYGRWFYEQLQVTQLELLEFRKQAPENKHKKADTVFIKLNGDFKNISLDDLFHLEANGDQVRLHTRFGQFMCNKSLSNYALKLEDSGYIRIHRSHLVRASAIASAEPTGDGRLLIHISNGNSIIASRKGSRAFKDHMK